jgi:hypothetical protein
MVKMLVTDSAADLIPPDLNGRVARGTARGKSAVRQTRTVYPSRWLASSQKGQSSKTFFLVPLLLARRFRFAAANVGISRPCAFRQPPSRMSS